MSIKNGLLALLAEGPSYGAALKAGFEARTGGTWPVNVGQVYTTLDRLQRDGLVDAEEPDAEGRIRYLLTATGRQAVDLWWRTPVDREVTPRDELVIKLAIAITSPDVDSAEVAQAQRAATMHRLQQLTRLKQSVDPATDLAWLLVVEHQLFAAEAEIRWLDQVEASVARHGRPGSRQARSAEGPVWARSAEGPVWARSAEGPVGARSDERLVELVETPGAQRGGSLARSRASSGSAGLGASAGSRVSGSVGDGEALA